MAVLTHRAGDGVRERLVAWAEDCRLRGSVELAEGRVSDQVNEAGQLTFFGVTLESLDDGHAVVVDELEVERGELHLIEVEGRRGDPGRRQRTVQELVEIRLGPFRVAGNLHRPPNTQPMAALSRWVRFVPVTDAFLWVKGRGPDPQHVDVVLVNRERIERSEPLVPIPIDVEDDWPGASRPASGGAEVDQADEASDTGSGGGAGTPVN